MIDPVLFAASVRRERRRKLHATATLGLIAAGLLFIPAMYIVSELGKSGNERLYWSALLAPLLAAVVFGALWFTTRTGESLTNAILHPGGAARPGEVHSHAEALAVRGDLSEAAAAFEAVRAEYGDTVASLRAEAEMHLAPGGNPERARELLVRLRTAVDVKRGDELYATHRLIDLYLGPLRQDGRAMVEMRRMAERFPGTPDAEGALAELQRRRALMTNSQDQA
jgi:hypothetical protein